MQQVSIGAVLHSARKYRTTSFAIRAWPCRCLSCSTFRDQGPMPMETMVPSERNGTFCVRRRLRMPKMGIGKRCWKLQICAMNIEWQIRAIYGLLYRCFPFRWGRCLFYRWHSVSAYRNHAFDSLRAFGNVLWICGGRKKKVLSRSKNCD